METENLKHAALATLRQSLATWQEHLATAPTEPVAPIPEGRIARRGAYTRLLEDGFSAPAVADLQRRDLVAAERCIARLAEVSPAFWVEHQHDLLHNLPDCLAQHNVLSLEDARAAGRIVGDRQRGVPDLTTPRSRAARQAPPLKVLTALTGAPKGYYVEYYQRANGSGLPGSLAYVGPFANADSARAHPDAGDRRSAVVKV